NDEPLLGAAAMPKEFPEYQAEKKKRQDELEDYRKTKENEVLTKVRGQVGDYLLVAREAAQADDDKKEGLARQRKLEPALLRHYQRALGDWRKSGQPVLAPWFALEALTETNFATRAKELCASFASGGDSSNHVNPIVARLFSPEQPPTALKEVAQHYN